MRNVRTTVAENLKRLRSKHNLTQAKLARRASVSRATIAAIEGRRYQSTSTDSIERLARAMGEPVGEFFLPARRKAS